MGRALARQARLGHARRGAHADDRSGPAAPADDGQGRSHARRRSAACRRGRVPAAASSAIACPSPGSSSSGCRDASSCRTSGAPPGSEACGTPLRGGAHAASRCGCSTSRATPVAGASSCAGNADSRAFFVSRSQGIRALAGCEPGRAGSPRGRSRCARAPSGSRARSRRAASEAPQIARPAIASPACARGGDRQGGVIERSASRWADDDHRQLERDGEIGERQPVDERLEETARALDDHAVAVAPQLDDGLDDRPDVDRWLVVGARRERRSERRLVVVDRRRDRARARATRPTSRRRPRRSARPSGRRGRVLAPGPPPPCARTRPSCRLRCRCRSRTRRESGGSPRRLSQGAAVNAYDVARAMLDRAVRRVEHERAIGGESPDDAARRASAGEQELDLEAAERVELVGVGSERLEAALVEARAERTQLRDEQARELRRRRGRRSPRAAARSEPGRPSRADRPRSHPRSCRRRAGRRARRSARRAPPRACARRPRRRSASARARRPRGRARRVRPRDRRRSRAPAARRAPWRAGGAPMRAAPSRAACASVRPRRPRPASCTSARTTVNAGAPATASVRSSSCVEPQRSSSTVRGAVGHVDTIGR